jgi:hypothetical protein
MKGDSMKNFKLLSLLAALVLVGCGGNNTTSSESSSESISDSTPSSQTSSSSETPVPVDLISISATSTVDLSENEASPVYLEAGVSFDFTIGYLPANASIKEVSFAVNNNRATVTDEGSVTIASDYSNLGAFFVTISPSDGHASDLVFYFVSVLPANIIHEGSVEEAIANPGTAYYETTSEVEVTERTQEEGVYTLKYEVGESEELQDIHFYLENAQGVEGSYYYLTLTLNSRITFTGSVNGVEQVFVRDDNQVALTFQEGEAVSLLISVVPLDESVGAANNIIVISDISFELKVFDSPEEIAIDGDVSDWENTMAYFVNYRGVWGVTPETAHKSVKFAAALTSTGLKLVAIAHHDVLKTTENAWWKNTNFEFFINGGNQYWVTAGPEGQQKATVDQRSIVTIENPEHEDGGSVYITVMEAFVSNANLPANSVVAGEIRVGVAWKTEGDINTGGEAAGGGEDAYWVPKGTWPNNSDQPFVDVNGFHKNSGINFTPTTLTIDGDLSDWEGYDAYTTNSVYLQGTDASAHKDVTWYAMLIDEGLFLAVKAHHDTFINDASAWYQNTNFEFFVNGAQNYVNSKNEHTTGNGIMVSREYTEGEAAYETIAEYFIPHAYYGTATSVRIGFAWKTPGDVIYGGGGTGVGGGDDWWFVAGHTPNNQSQAFYIYEDGIFESAKA